MVVRLLCITGDVLMTVCSQSATRGWPMTLMVTRNGSSCCIMRQRPVMRCCSHVHGCACHEHMRVKSLCLLGAWVVRSFAQLLTDAAHGAVCLAGALGQLLAASFRLCMHTVSQRTVRSGAGGGVCTSHHRSPTCTTAASHTRSAR